MSQMEHSPNCSEFRNDGFYIFETKQWNCKNAKQQVEQKLKVHSALRCKKQLQAPVLRKEVLFDVEQHKQLHEQAA